MDSTGRPMTALFAPEAGMSLLSFKVGEVELIQTSTQKKFDDTREGLGTVVGPHFSQRHATTYPKIPSDCGMPQIPKLTERGFHDLIPNGIARYASWKVASEESSFKAELTGKDLLGTIPLSQLQGQNFKIEMAASLQRSGLKVELSVVSDIDSLIGLDYRFRLPESKGEADTRVQPYTIHRDGRQGIPKTWNFDNHFLHLNLENEVDVFLQPFPDLCEGTILLKTADYTLQTNYWCSSAENHFGLFKPKGEEWISIQPMTSSNPYKPQLSVSSIKIHFDPLISDR